MLAPSGGGLILYQAYGNLYAMTGRKAHLLEDKQIPSVGVFDEVFNTWMAFGGNTRDLGSFGEETNKITDLHQIHEEVLFTERGDGVTCIKTAIDNDKNSIAFPERSLTTPTCSSSSSTSMQEKNVPPSITTFEARPPKNQYTTLQVIHSHKIYTIGFRRKKKKSLDYNNSFLGEYECSSLALDREERRDEKKRLDHLKQDQTMLVIKRFSERKKVFKERKNTGKIHAERSIFSAENSVVFIARNPQRSAGGGPGGKGLS
ncbi:hypothetical protein Tco_0933527, partial [Tanacetum coccineum]